MIIVIIIFIVFISFLVLHILNLLPQFRGKHGEDKIYKIISRINDDGKILRNIYLPTANNNFIEIDLLYITKFGICVIESKNYKGWIFGDENSKYWMQIIYNSKNKFFNPIMQNRIHINNLKKLVGYSIPCISIIVFSNKCLFKKLIYNINNSMIIKQKELKSIIKNLRKSDCCLNENDIMDLYEKLGEYCNIDKIVKKEHIKYIRNKYKK